MNPLKDLDQIHADKELKEKTLRYVMSKRSHRISKRLVLACTFAFLCVCSFLFFKTTNIPSNKTDVIQVAAYVSLDVNPSMEIQLDKNYHVVKTIAYNKDAKRILKQTNIKGKTMEDALSTLVKNPLYNNYIDNGFLEASVYAKDDKVTNRVYKILNTALENNLNQDQYHCAQINQEQHATATTHHISGGKYRLIEQIQAFDATYDVNDLNQRSVRELYEILNQFDPSIVPERCGGTQSNQHEQHNGHK